MDQVYTSEIPIQTATVVNQPKYAGFWRRFFAYFVDQIILGVVSGVIGGSVGMMLGMSQVFTQIANHNLNSNPAINPIYSVTGGAIGIIIGILYYSFFWSKHSGQTLGNKLMAIRVVHEDGSYIDFVTGIVRFVGYMISGLIFYLGFLWVIWDPKKQGWHDKIAKTVVVETGEQPKKGLVGGICGCCCLLYVGIIVAVIASGAGMASFLKQNPQALKDVVQKNVNETTVVTQTDADNYAFEVFTKVGAYRVAHGINQYVEDPKLCAFAQRRLEQLTTLGRLDDHKGFYEDMANSTVASAYFDTVHTYGEITTSVSASAINDPNPVPDTWITAQGLDSAKIIGACTRATPQFLVFLTAATK